MLFGPLDAPDKLIINKNTSAFSELKMHSIHQLRWLAKQAVLGMLRTIHLAG
jgi:hypothetical protein